LHPLFPLAIRKGAGTTEAVGLISRDQFPFTSGPGGEHQQIPRVIAIYVAHPSVKYPNVNQLPRVAQIT
jgi:hypothetical protein